MKNRNLIGTLLLWLMCLTPLTGSAIPVSDPSNQHNFSHDAMDTNPLTGNPHPRAAAPANRGTTEICVFCHTPHGAAPQSTLWNRTTLSSFPLYGGELVIKGDFNVADATLHSQYNSALYPYPNGASKLCLSCHDGVTAIGAVIDGTAFNMFNNLNTINAMGDARLVIDLATSHPISFVYDSQVWQDINSVKPLQYQLPTLVDVPLDGQQRMQCTTCHDPHEDTRAAVGLPFWRHTNNVVDGAFEDVCNDCHLADKTGPPQPVLHNM